MTFSGGSLSRFYDFSPRTPHSSALRMLYAQLGQIIRHPSNRSRYFASTEPGLRMYF